MRRFLISAALLAMALALASCGGSSKPKAYAQAGLVGSAQSAGQAKDYQPTGKIIADDGFRPNPDGFSFENYPNFEGGIPQNLTAENVYDLFGDAVCQAGSGSSCVLTPTAAKWMDIENQRMAGGHCMGFSVTALRFFEHNLAPSSFGAGSPFGLPIRNNLGLQSELAENWVFQDLQRVRANAIEGSPTQVLQGLVDALNSGGNKAYSGNGYGSRGELYTLVLFKRDGSGGHAITPYAVEKQGNGHYVILVYDNNFPGVTRPFYVDTNNDTWKYVGGINPSDTSEIYDGDASSKNFSLLPTSPGIGTQPCPFCNGGSGGTAGSVGSTIGASSQYNQITLTGSATNHAHLILFDQKGNHTGFFHGKTVNQIPGAEIVQTLSSQTWAAAPEPAYRVPVGTIVGVVIDAGDLTKPDNESITLVGPGLYGGVEDIKLFPGERDVIAFGGGGKGFVYRTTAGHASTPGLALGLEEHGVGYAMAVAAAGTKGGSQIALYSHPDGTLTWDTGGTKGSAFKGFAIYVVEIERLTKNGNTVWSTARIVLKKGWRAALDYRHAVPGKPITVFTGPPGHLTFKQKIDPGNNLPGQSG